MKIAICGSMQFTEKMFEMKEALEKLGHQAVVSDFGKDYLNKTSKEIEKLKLYHKYEKDAIKEFWEEIKKSDAILVLNYDKKGISNYIGGNTLMEIGFAHVLNKKIFLLNPVPEIEYYKTEIEATKPIILAGDLTKITAS
jgi:predicted RNA-binding protein with PUA domain